MLLISFYFFYKIFNFASTPTPPRALLLHRPTLFDIGEDYGIDNIIRSIRDAKTDEQREILFQNTTSSPYFFLSFEQAQMLFEEMQGLNRLPLELMSSILPQVRITCSLGRSVGAGYARVMYSRYFGEYTSFLAPIHRVPLLLLLLLLTRILPLLSIDCE